TKQFKMRTGYPIQRSIIILIFISCFSRTGIEKHPPDLTDGDWILLGDVRKHFDSCGVEGSIVIYDQGRRQWIVSDTTEIERESLPASTFKIINLLIALETNAIADENEIIY